MGRDGSEGGNLEFTSKTKSKCGKKNSLSSRAKWRSTNLSHCHLTQVGTWVLWVDWKSQMTRWRPCPKKSGLKRKKMVETFGEKVWIHHKFCDLPRVGEITWKGNCGEANQVENQPNDTNSLINDYFPDLGNLGNPKQHVGTCESFANNVALAKWSKQGFCWRLWQKQKKPKSMEKQRVMPSHIKT